MKEKAMTPYQLERQSRIFDGSSWLFADTAVTNYAFRDRVGGKINVYNLAYGSGGSRTYGYLQLNRAQAIATGALESEL